MAPPIPELISSERAVKLLGISPEEWAIRVSKGWLPQPVVSSEDGSGDRWSWAEILKKEAEAFYIYFVQLGEFIKIGRSQNPRSRIAELQRDTPFELIILHVERNDPPFEREMHTKFLKLHHRGEWFHAERQLLDFIKLRKQEVGALPWVERWGIQQIQRVPNRGQGTHGSYR